VNIYRYLKRKCLHVLITALIFPCVISGEVFADEGKVLTWQQCVKTAELNNPDIISAREKILQYAAESKIVRSDLLPQVTASFSGSRSRAETDYSGWATSKNYYYGLSAKQLVFDGFTSLYDLESADADLKTAKLEYRVTSASIRCNLRKAWIDYMKSEKMLKISSEIHKRRKHVYELVKLRYNAGKEHIGSLHSTKADLMQSEADTAEAERDLALAKTTLCHLMGSDDTAVFSIEGELEVASEYESEPDFTILASRNPSVLKAASAKDSAYYSLRSAKLDYSPKLYGNAGIGRSGETLDTMNGEWSIGFEITAPLFEGGKTYYTVSKASASYRQSRADLKSAENTASASLRESWNALKNGLDSVKVEKASLTASEERSSIGEMQYSIGTLSFDNWTIIENNLASAKKAYINACATALTAEAGWIEAKGGTLEDENKN